MLLELNQIIRSGGSLPFAFTLDLSELEFYGSRPYAEPIRVEGEVANHAGMLVMSGRADTTLHVSCSRCGKPLLVELNLPFEHLLAEHLEDEENDEILLLDGTVLDAGDAVTDDLVYGLESSYLCKEDCKGRCFRCGKDLNEGPCACVPELDPRMAKLSEWLKQHEE
ncbi:MAG: DUF177 domain-containing protein [Oscillospiraceae bacterium]|nr:DUF177 domain-containing protein [Oscillospiraceae bacterium]